MALHVTLVMLLMTSLLAEAASLRQQSADVNQTSGYRKIFEKVQSMQATTLSSASWSDDVIEHVHAAQSPFAAYVYSPSLYRDMCRTLFRHTLGAVAAAQLDLQFGQTLADLLEKMEAYAVEHEIRPKTGDGQRAPADGDSAPADGHRSPADGQRPPADGDRATADGQRAPADVHQILLDIQELRHQLEQLIRLNEVLRFLDHRLEQIEDFIDSARPDDSEKIMKEIEKVMRDITKEMEKIVKEVRKILRSYEDWLQSVDDEVLMKLFRFLNFLIKNGVTIGEDGIYVDGELVIEIDDDLAGVCCSFG